MTDQEAELIQKLAMSLDATMELVAERARKEKRVTTGVLRPITWQKREKAFAELIDEARDALSAKGKVVYF